MGSFFGSIHLRTDDRAAVQSAAAAVARRRRAKFYLAPPRGGWVTLYPSDGGQDERVAASVAKAAGGWAVWVSLHDDDVFAYAVWRDGRVVDRFNSCPDYFGEELSPAVRRRVAGKPAKFADLLPQGVGPAEVKAALEAGESAFAAASQLAAFARCLGLPGVETSYEYLAGGETEGVAGWGEFTHVPKQSRVDKRADRRRRWRESGALLVEDARRAGPRSPTMPILCPDPMSGGFLSCWCDFGPNATSTVERHPLPWRDGPVPTGVEFSPPIWPACTSPDGRWIAAEVAAPKASGAIIGWPGGGN